MNFISCVSHVFEELGVLFLMLNRLLTHLNMEEFVNRPQSVIEMNLGRLVVQTKVQNMMNCGF